uniref:Ribosomal protein S11 n=1 Tax=Pterocladiella musciformis TaxID=2699131 RepID=A0A1D8X7T1_9FLOR|nr:ribosomal protein S11 [Pterocladiella musciformis]AOX49087.1 ribosomal protein S11 [Pterocladiella musciformis]
MKSVVLKVLFTSTNILCTLVDIEGKVIFWTSVGTRKIKGTKKITLISINTMLKEVVQKLNETNCQFLYLEIKGFSKNKKTIIKFFKNSLVNIVLICDKTALPHNGCKRKKVRRV